MIDATLVFREGKVPSRKVGEHNPVHEVTDPSASAATFVNMTVSQCVQFCPTIRVEKLGQRRTQLASECSRVATSDGAIVGGSASLQTGRALPKLPLEVYSAICKTRRANTAFFDEDGNPTYESIDLENDSLIYPLYSKLGDVVSSHPERKYDYPVFSAKETSPSTHNYGGVDYQSSSQVYIICGSEDPYSSITPEPRSSTTAVDRDACTSSACDAGYAKVKQGIGTSWRKETVKCAEFEVDQIYSKIRRPSLITVDDTFSPLEVPNPAADKEIGDGIVAEISRPNSMAVDTESLSSREPSYRYITIRESAELVRERLRVQGQLTLPAREHYYSVIGNEYETVGDVPSTYTYSTVVIPRSQGMLNVTMLLPEFVPPPPTSPIPGRTPCNESPTLASGLQQPSSSNTQSVITPSYSVLSKTRATTSQVDVFADGTAEGATEPSFLEGEASGSPNSKLPSATKLNSELNVVLHLSSIEFGFMQRPMAEENGLCDEDITTERRKLMEVNRTTCSNA
ncbi:hypothetical protein RB195_023274 [Necator americanus]|uniref:Uncharacterized protein n=1 Tax=Necator americanus TaxID=51031 RepID=A0ABR1EIH3_NECAM